MENKETGWSEQSNKALANFEKNRPIFLQKRDGEDIEAMDEKQLKKRPRKAKYRMRAHLNPLNDTPYPL